MGSTFMGHGTRQDSDRELVVGKNPCLWMTAGLVNFKLCDMNYDCMNCKFDKGIGKKLAEQGAPRTVGANWRKVFSALPAEKRYCRHMLSGYVKLKICDNGFMCNKCQFDQMIEDTILASDPTALRTVRDVEGFTYPESYHYHRGHAYALIDYGGRIKVGLDDFSSRLVGVVDKIDVPGLGETVQANETGWEVKREGATARMLSPISGVVTAINNKAIKFPELVNRSPYESGWLYVLEPTRMKPDIKNLLFADEVAQWAKGETARLRSMTAGELGATASAGGAPTRDIFNEVREIGWDRLTREFFLVP